MSRVADLKTEHLELVDQVAQLMTDFHLSEASLEQNGSKVAFRRRPAKKVVSDVESVEFDEPVYSVSPPVSAAPSAPSGTPVSSPMTGVYYSTPSPGASPFVKEGDAVIAGQVVALIEAMKVMSEVTSPLSGTVLKIVAQSGAVVQPGEPLLFVG